MLQAVFSLPLLELTKDPFSYMKEDHPTVDADQVWVDLCREDATAMQYFKSFLQVYVETSVYQRVVLDDDREEVEERSIKSSRSLNTFWKSLIAAADAEILLPMRENSENHWMTLKRPTNMPGSLDPLYHVEVS